MIRTYIFDLDDEVRPYISSFQESQNSIEWFGVQQSYSLGVKIQNY